MPEFPILCLPIKLQALVVRSVAQNSFEDLFCLGATCNSMRSLTDKAEVYASLDMFKYPWRMLALMLRRLLRRCFLEGNPSTLYIKGVEYFYRQDRQEEGLALIKRAADAGFERALYTYAMTTAVWSGDGTRASVSEFRKVVRKIEGIWHRDHNQAFLIMQAVFIAKIVPLFYSCPCSPILYIDWELWHIEDIKAEDMCNHCFWIKEFALSYATLRHPPVIWTFLPGVKSY